MAVLGAVVLFGCVERELTITSEPAGALVVLSDIEVGRTPVTVPFTWYGDYDIILRLDGYETLDTSAEINMPFYEIPPLDLLVAIAPWTHRDQRYLHYELEPLELPDDEELLEDARQMREETLTPVR